jgi:epoxyqueuosine reductase
MKFFARDTLNAPLLADLARLDDAAFRAVFKKSAIKRIGRDRFVRNVLIAIGNSDDTRLAGEAERLLDDASPLVRGAAVWALGRLDQTRLAQCAGKRRGQEAHSNVIEEWTAACG